MEKKLKSIRTLVQNTIDTVAGLDDAYDGMTRDCHRLLVYLNRSIGAINVMLSHLPSEEEVGHVRDTAGPVAELEPERDS